MRSAPWSSLSAARSSRMLSLSGIVGGAKRSPTCRASSWSVLLPIDLFLLVGNTPLTARYRGFSSAGVAPAPSVGVRSELLGVPPQGRWSVPCRAVPRCRLADAPAPRRGGSERRRERCSPHARRHTRVRDGRLGRRRGLRNRGRSEEQTSELQSLMRISYAVFCLKQKKTL